MNKREGETFIDKFVTQVMFPVLRKVLTYAGTLVVDAIGTGLKRLWGKWFSKTDDKQTLDMETTENEKAEENVKSSEFEETMDIPEKESKALIGNLICAEDTVLVFAQSDIGKSRIACQLVTALAGGMSELSLPGHPIANSPQHVFYFDTEGQDKILLQLKQAFPKVEKPEYIHYLKPKEGNPTLEGICKNIETQINNSKYGDCMVVIDNLSTFTDVTKPNDVVNFLKNKSKRLKDIKRRQGHHLTILLLSHTTKRAPLLTKSLQNPMLRELPNYSNSATVCWRWNCQE